MRVLWLLLLPCCVLAGACQDQTRADAGPRISPLAKGIAVALDPLPQRVTDGGPLVVTMVMEGGMELWAVDKPTLGRVLAALPSNSGTALATALETHPAVDPALLARARAVKGRDPVSEQAEAALVGPLSLPVGGLHAPVYPRDAALQSSRDPACQDVLQRPGTVGKVLAGVGRVRVIMLLQGEDLKRYAACVDGAAPVEDAGAAALAEYTRLKALMRMGQTGQASVLVGLGAR